MARPGMVRATTIDVDPATLARYLADAVTARASVQTLYDTLPEQHGALIEEAISQYPDLGPIWDQVWNALRLSALALGQPAPLANQSCRETEW